MRTLSAVVMALLTMALLQARVGPTVYVVNDSSERVVVYQDSHRIGEVGAMTEKCLSLTELSVIALSVRVLAERNIYKAPAVFLSTSKGWVWRLRDKISMSVIDIRPSEVCR